MDRGFSYRSARGTQSSSTRGFPSSYRGRYGSSYRGARGHSVRQFQPRPIAPSLGHLFTTIESSKLDNGKKDGEKIGITNCKYIASYNLMDDLNTKIYVPGAPPAWTPLPGTNQLREDAGTYYRDDNAARFPVHPLEPAVNSIFAMNESFDPAKIDIFGCGSTLGNLLRFARGKNEQPFTFVVQKIGKTVFFVRRARSPTELLEGVFGYGHTFPEANTTWPEGLKGSGSHQRIAEYEFGGLKMLVRFEADGYVVDKADCSGDGHETFETVKDAQAEPDAPLEDVFANMLSSKFPEDAAAERLIVENRGSRIPQSSLLDLKTRAAHKHLDDIMAEELPRLWVRQVSNFVLAFHELGKFAAPEVRDVSVEIAEWEAGMQEALWRMAHLMERIRDAVMTVSEGKLEVRSDGSGGLQLRELSGTEGGEWNALPEAAEEAWKGRVIA